MRAAEERNMKVAIVHDWLTGLRGGEKVLEVLCELYPDAPIYTLFCDYERISPFLRERKIKTSFLQGFPFRKKKYRSYLPLFPLAVEQFDLRDYDLVLSSSHCVAKGVLTTAETCHICYCHTPLRYGWDMYQEYFGRNRGLTGRLLIYPVMNYLRLWDVSSSNRADYFIANSRYVAGRIEKHYRREAEVIHPPVDTEFFEPGGERREFYLVVSALVPYKRIDVAVDAFTNLGYPLKIAGGGPEKKRLQKRAGGNVEFLGEVSRGELKTLYQECRMLIFPGIEDFGIAPLEAQSAGSPVIAYGRGGLLETVIENETGLFFHAQTPGSLEEALKRSSGMVFEPQKIRENGLKYDRALCKEKIGVFIERKFEEWMLKRNRRFSR